MEEILASILAALCLLVASAQVDPAVKTEAQRELDAKFPYYFTGTSTFGQPVYLVEWKKWDLRAAIQEGTPTELLDEVYTKFYTTVIQDGLSTGNGSILVADLNGFNPAQVETSTLQQLVLKQALKFEKLNPEGGLKQVYIFNANKAYSDLFNAVRPSLKDSGELFKLYTEDVNEWSLDLLSYLKLDPKTRTELSGTSPLQVLLNEEFPQELRTKFPYYLSGYAPDGTPIFIMPLGKYDYKSVIEKGSEYSEQLSRLMSQMLLRLYTSSVKAPGGRGAILILDAKGLSVEQIETDAVRKHMVSNFAMMNKINSEPGLRQIYVIYVTPTVNRKLLEDLESSINTSGNIQVFCESEDFRSALREEVKTPIPEEYGGTGDYAPLILY